MKKMPFTLPPVSSYPSRKEWETACWQKILKTGEILNIIITSRERRNLVLRAAAITRINSGKKYQEIADELWVSPQTISGIKKALKENNYRSYRVRNERKKRIYSSSGFSRRRPHGRPVRTKYGTIYLP